MPASAYLEEAFLKAICEESKTYTGTKIWLELTKFKPSTFLKATTGTEAGNESPSEGSAKNSWVRPEVGAAAKPGWTLVKGTGNESEAKYTILENTNAIKTGSEAWEFKKTSGGSFLCETFCLCDSATAGNVLAFGKLEVPVTITSAVTLEIAAKALKIELL